MPAAVTNQAEVNDQKKKKNSTGLAVVDTTQVVEGDIAAVIQNL